MYLVNECQFRATAGGLGDFVVASAITGFFTPAQTTAPSITDGGEYRWRAESDDLSQHELFIGTYTAAGTTVARTTILQSSNGGAKVNFSAAPRVRQVALSQDFSNLRDNVASGEITTPTAELIIMLPSQYQEFVLQTSEFTHDDGINYGYLDFEVSSDGGSSWETGAGAYNFFQQFVYGDGGGIFTGYAYNLTQSFGRSFGFYLGAIPSVDGRAVGRIYPGSPSSFFRVDCTYVGQDLSGLYQDFDYSQFETVGRQNALRIFSTSGNIATLKYVLIGLNIP